MAGKGKAKDWSYGDGTVLRMDITDFRTGQHLHVKQALTELDEAYEDPGALIEHTLGKMTKKILKAYRESR